MDNYNYNNHNNNNGNTVTVLENTRVKEIPMNSVNLFSEETITLIFLHEIPVYLMIYQLCRKYND